MKRQGLLSLFACLLLSSCSFSLAPSSSSSSESTFSSSQETSSESSSIESISSSSSQQQSYPRDENGYCILPEDYFSTPSIEDGLRKSRILIPQDIPEALHYPQMKLFANGHPVPVYNVKTNIDHTWTPDAKSRMNNAAASIALEGKVKFQIQASFGLLDQVEISPLGKNVAFQTDDAARVLTFEIDDPGQYLIRLRSDRCLHLFVNPIRESETRTIYFGPGLHNKANDSRFNSNGEMALHSGDRVYIDPSAIVQGRFTAYRQNDIKIFGSGYIDGSCFARSATTGEVTVPIDFNYCTNVTLQDFAVLDPAGWTFNMYFCNGVTIENTKIISSRSNGDGISLQSCQNVVAKDCFVRSWDDSLVVKNYPEWSNRNSEGTTKNILFENCLLFTDLAQSMEIGFETVGQVMEGIRFKNITVAANYHKPVFSIHNSNNANLKDVTFEKVTVEHAEMGKGDGSTYLVEFSNEYSSTWSNGHKTTSLGSTQGVNVKNVKILAGITNPKISVRGAIDPRSEYGKDVHMISDVRFTDFELYGNKLDESFEGFSTVYSSNVTFESTDNPITGATYQKTQSNLDEFGEGYTLD